MKILLDECVPWPIRKLLAEHECSNPFKCGWSAATNGDLLELAKDHFDLFITCDKNLRYQQNLVGRSLPILELSTNDLRRILASDDLLSQLVGSIQQGEYICVEIP
jgi:predicted nuclease of predicted toxin-antitoxin system